MCQNKFAIYFESRVPIINKRFGPRDFVQKHLKDVCTVCYIYKQALLLVRKKPMILKKQLTRSDNSWFPHFSSRSQIIVENMFVVCEKDTKLILGIFFNL